MGEDREQKQDPRTAQALACAGGDEQKAKGLLDGTLKDAIALKGKFSIPEADLCCNFVVFAHAETGAFLNISIIIYGNMSIWGPSDPSLGWREYYRSCEKIAKSVTLSDASDFVAHLSASMSGYDIFSDMTASDAESAASKIQDITEKFYGLKNIECLAYIEPVSTLELADERISVCAPQQKQDQPAAQPSADTRPEIEKNAQLVVEAKAIISPLDGKRVHDLVKGDRLLVMLVNRDGASLKIAETLGAFDEDRNYKPMKARIVEMLPVEKVGYWIYVALAKNALGKIVEEGNVQVAVDTGQAPNAKQIEKEKEAADKNIVMYIALLIGLIAIAGLLIYAIM